MHFEMIPIGTIHTPHKTKASCPIQTKVADKAPGTVTVFPEYAAGLKDIEEFTHLYLFYRFDRAGDIQLVRPTFLDDAAHGIYASRHPARPNGLGLSIVTLVARDGCHLRVDGVDMLDGSPLLDIKPYIPRFDLFPEASDGWVSDKVFRPKPAGRE
jgi:tRNA (adenine37-N6)-methyltransferase